MTDSPGSLEVEDAGQNRGFLVVPDVRFSAEGLGLHTACPDHAKLPGLIHQSFDRSMRALASHVAFCLMKQLCC